MTLFPRFKTRLILFEGLFVALMAALYLLEPTTNLIALILMLIVGFYSSPPRSTSTPRTRTTASSTGCMQPARRGRLLRRNTSCTFSRTRKTPTCI